VRRIFESHHGALSAVGTFVDSEALQTQAIAEHCAGGLVWIDQE
jgi:hypothetical protein